MMDKVLFIVFSTIEAVSIFTIALTLYRYNPMQYMRQILPISVLMALLSYAVWFETTWQSYFPLVSLLLFTFFIFYTLRISLFGAAMVAVTGYGLVSVVQTVYLFLLQMAEVISVSDVQDHRADYYILTALSSSSVILLSYVLFRKGYGFSFSLNQFKAKWENVVVILVLLAAAGFVAVLHFFKNELSYAGITLVVIVGFLLYLALRKERA